MNLLMKRLVHNMHELVKFMRTFWILKSDLKLKAGIL